jgi:hypothetical protein
MVAHNGLVPGSSPGGPTTIWGYVPMIPPTKPKADRPTYVYIIAYGDLVKIGISCDPKRRLKDMLTGLPDKKPYVARTRLLPNERDARSLERRLHRLFRERRVRGEWFRVTVAVAAHAMNTVHFHRPGENSQAIIADVFRKIINEPTML